MPVDAIAEVWSVEATEVVKILESMQSSNGEDCLGNSSSGTVSFWQSIGDLERSEIWLQFLTLESCSQDSQSRTQEGSEHGLNPLATCSQLAISMLLVPVVTGLWFVHSTCSTSSSNFAKGLGPNSQNCPRDFFMRGGAAEAQPLSLDLKLLQLAWLCGAR